MALIQRTSPIDVDKEITLFQTYLFNNVGYADWACYDRVYINPKSVSGDAPERYTLDGDYEETLYNDGFDISSFFIDAPDRVVNPSDDEMLVTVSLIVQADLKELFPVISHRADEELVNRIIAVSQSYPSYERFKFTGIEKGIARVYREFDTTKIRFDDMSNQFVVRFNFQVKYAPKCCTDC